MMNKVFLAINTVQLVVLIVLLFASGFNALCLAGIILGAVMFVWNLYDIIKERKENE